MTRTFLLLMLIALATVAPVQTVTAVQQPAPDASPVIYLHTEFNPRADLKSPWRLDRLSREIARQAFLVAVRDELGLATRDGTLREVVPSDVDVIHLALLVRSDYKDKTDLRLYRFPPDDREHDTHGLWDTEPVWAQSYQYDPGWISLYAGLSKEMEKAVSSDFVDALKTVGIERAVNAEVKQSSGETLPEHWQGLIEDVDYVSQLSLIREVHEFIQQHGETPELIGVLVRAYAHLSILTDHHWNASSDVFAARSIVYANRLAAVTKESDLSLWHRAYAWALTGSHHYALADIKKIRDRRKKDSGLNKDLKSEDPNWTKLAETYCLCDRERMEQLADENPAIRAWGLRLWFKLTYLSRYPIRINRDAQVVAREIPTAYTIYAQLAQTGVHLGPTRTGARIGPMIFGKQLPISLAKQTFNFEPIDILVEDSDEGRRQRTFLEDPDPNDAFSPLPTTVAKELRELSRSDQSHGISWSALAYLIDEEVFLMACNSLKVSTNATESSHVDEVDAVWPFVKHHRYACLIKAFRYNKRLESDQRAKVIAPLELEDPVRRMSTFALILVDVKNEQGVDLRELFNQSTSPNHTFQDLVEYWYLYGYGPRFPRSVTTDYGRQSRRELRTVAPNSEIGIRMELLQNTKPRKLRALEKQIRSDPKCFEILGDRYKMIGLDPEAIRCYEKSLELLASSSATRSLAEIYYQKKQFEKWEQTYLNFFETEDLGLTHQSAKLKLCDGFIRQGLFHEAKPYAIETARTWSARGLIKASFVAEMLGQWEESEKWIREASESYPTGSGWQWYFWCCRTGRGDLEAARLLAETYMRGLSEKTRSECITQGACHLLEGDQQQALESYRKALAFKPTLTCTWMVAHLSRKLNDEPARTQTITALKNYLQKSTEPNDIKGFQTAAIQLLETGKASDELLKQLEAEYLKLVEINQGAFGYYLGVELDAIGKPKLAEKYFRRSMICLKDQTHGTLAGAELVEKHGTSRTDDDEVTPATMWPSPGKNDSKVDGSRDSKK